MDQHVASCDPCAYAARPGASGHGRSPSWQREMVGGGKQEGEEEELKSQRTGMVLICAPPQEDRVTWDPEL